MNYVTQLYMHLIYIYVLLYVCTIRILIIGIIIGIFIFLLALIFEISAKYRLADFRFLSFSLFYSFFRSNFFVFHCDRASCSISEIFYLRSVSVHLILRSTYCICFSFALITIKDFYHAISSISHFISG